MWVALLVLLSALAVQDGSDHESKEASLFRRFEESLRQAERELRTNDLRQARRSILEARDYLARVPSIPIIQTYWEEAAAECGDSLDRALDALTKERASEALAAVMACREEARSVRRRWTA